MVKNNQGKIVLLGALVALTTALPQPAPVAGGVDKVVAYGDPNAPASIDLPFLQFKNGGVRVNFAGYHAEAGLGGLLGGTGGLFASAGTPWGPSASAGLGGTLNGEDGSARGGLHARAGLGNGGPEAAAGLGGTLDGSGRSGSRASGGLFAGATAGGPTAAAAAGLGGTLGGNGGSGSSGGAFAGTSAGGKTRVIVKDVSNIQPVPPPGEKVYLAKSESKDASTSLEFKIPGRDTKKDVSSSIVTRELANSGPKYDMIGANAVSAGKDDQDITDLSYPARRYYRKRLRELSPGRKNFYKLITTNAGPVADTPVALSTANAGGRIVTRQAIDDRSPAVGTANVPYAARAKGPTLFDDIFNIPISALTAVNQLLNNNSG